MFACRDKYAWEYYHDVQQESSNFPPEGYTGQIRPYCLRSTRKWASCLRVSARPANESSAAQPELISASARRRDSSIPNREGYVAFSEAVSLPAVLPNCSDDCVTSSTSS